MPNGLWAQPDETTQVRPSADPPKPDRNRLGQQRLQSA